MESNIIMFFEYGIILFGAKVLWGINKTIKTQKETIDALSSQINSQKTLIENFKNQAEYLKNLQDILHNFYNLDNIKSIVKINKKVNITETNIEDTQTENSKKESNNKEISIINIPEKEHHYIMQDTINTKNEINSIMEYFIDELNTERNKKQ